MTVGTYHLFDDDEIKLIALIAIILICPTGQISQELRVFWRN